MCLKSACVCLHDRMLCTITRTFSYIARAGISILCAGDMVPTVGCTYMCESFRRAISQVNALELELLTHQVVQLSVLR